VGSVEAAKDASRGGGVRTTVAAADVERLLAHALVLASVPGLRSDGAVGELIDLSGHDPVLVSQAWCDALRQSFDTPGEVMFNAERLLSMALDTLRKEGPKAAATAALLLDAHLHPVTGGTR